MTKRAVQIAQRNIVERVDSRSTKVITLRRMGDCRKFDKALDR
jgi:hypothetical protein